MGNASMEFTVRSAPLGGNCTIDPPTGFALNTSFELSCQDWTGLGDSTPFAYRYHTCYHLHTVVSELTH